MDALKELFAAAPPWIFGVVNITPDSFSDGGRYQSTEDAVRHGEELCTQGAHALDIGGEATGPGTKPVTAAEELSRIEQTVRALCSRTVISVDTYKAAIARRCLELGARIVNDTSALRADGAMADVVAEHGAFVILMFAKGAGPLPHANDDPMPFSDVVSGTAEFLLERAAFAERNGIARSRIILDPGMGRFLSNEAEDSWELLRRFDELCEMVAPYPVMIGASRKGFLGGALKDRDPISQLAVLHAVRAGASLVRTHRPGLALQFLEAGARLTKK